MPLLYVPGNHDPSLKPPDTTWMPLSADVPAPGPAGCESVDGRVVETLGLRIAGLGGSLRYKPGPNQYTQGQAGRRAMWLEVAIRLKRVRQGRKLDVLVTHAPPSGLEEADDPAHAGLVAALRLIQHFQPLIAVHGHVHPFGRVVPERRVGSTRIINVVPSRVIEI